MSNNQSLKKHHITKHKTFSILRFSLISKHHRKGLASTILHTENFQISHRHDRNTPWGGEHRDIFQKINQIHTHKVENPSIDESRERYLTHAREAEADKHFFCKYYKQISNSKRFVQRKTSDHFSY